MCSDLVNFDDVCLAVVIDSCLPLRVCVTVVEWADDLAEYTGSKPSDFDLSSIDLSASSAAIAISRQLYP